MDKIKLETKHVSIEFPGVKALDDIDFEVTTGEIRAVVGANGAGKSTLMKVLAGANPAYTGEVFLNNKKVEIRTPVDAKKLGIQIVYQEVDTALYPTLSVAENIVQNDMVMGKSGYIVSFGGLFGNHIYKGEQLLPLITDEETLFRVTDAAIGFFEEHANPGERFRLLLQRVGEDEFRKVIRNAFEEK